MKRDEVFVSKYFKAADVKAKPIVAVIEDIVIEEVGVGNDKKPKPVMILEGLDKRLVINSTNWDALAEVLGDESDGWIGHKVRIHTVSTMYQGKRVDGIRVTVAREDEEVSAA